jgi:two-component system CitB family sensor kinase
MTRTALFQSGIVLLAVVIVGGALVRVFYNGLTTDYGRFCIGVARSVATDPEVQAAFRLPDSASVLQPLAEQVRQATGVSFIVIVNRDQIRYTHPDPTKIGQRVSTDASEALSGVESVTTQQGTLGVSVRGKVPIRDEAGEIIGAVSVGVLVQNIQQTALGAWGTIAGSVAIGLAFGVLGSIVLAMRVKRETLGLEPAEIAAIYQQRQAMLQAMREGVIAVDETGRITTINEEGCRLLGLDTACVGRSVAETLPGSHLPDVVRTGQPRFDQLVVRGGRILVANSVPMLLREQIVGAVVTYRDHTEVDGLTRQLDNMRQYADSLRAQSHEFTNKLHTIGGLLELGLTGQAISYIAQTATSHLQRHDSVTRCIKDPVVAAVLIGKAAVAAERGVTLTLHPASCLRTGLGISDELITIVGNLVQNALEAVSSLEPERRRITVTIRDRGGSVRIRVRDWGAGVEESILERIFEPGFTTKSATQRGIGLALVKGLVTRRAGTIAVHNNRGAVFTVTIPINGDIGRVLSF